MPENPYEAPKEGPEREAWQWPCVELMLLYVVGIPLVALLIGFAFLAWAAIRATD